MYYKCNETMCLYKKINDKLYEYWWVESSPRSILMWYESNDDSYLNLRPITLKEFIDVKRQTLNAYPEYTKAIDELIKEELKQKFYNDLLNT